LVALCAAAVLAAALTASLARAQTPAAAVFPSKIADKYAKESPGRARMHTCLDQYKANKASNANGGLKWLAKNGYYSQCNKKLNGAT